MEKQSLVSIIIPTYNRSQRLVNTLKSVQGQTYGNWECLVIDDGSTDDTQDVVNAFAKADKRFSFHQRPSSKPKGANACRNFGFQLSKGKYVNWLDSDDLLLEEKLAEQTKVLDETSSVFTICQTDLWDEVCQENQGLRCEAITSQDPFNDYICFNIFWSIQAPLWRRETVSVFPFDETLHQSQEYEYHIRILAQKYDYHTTDKVLTTIVSHDANLSKSDRNNTKKLRSNIKVRYFTLKRYPELLLPATQQYLYKYIFDFYKTALMQRQFDHAAIAMRFLIKSFAYVKEIKEKGYGNLIRWMIAYPSYLITKRGHKWITYIR